VLLGLCYVLITKTFTDFAAVGIGVHHAGVSIDDRRATEQLYLKKVLRILVATSVRNYISYHFPESVHDILSRRWLLVLTCVRSKVASRLNVKFLTPPAAHMVVIKGVRTFQNGKSQEYSDLDIMQMLGRAVRHALSA
jgi:ATP-dependent DNA helicase HFM1/MER3